MIHKKSRITFVAFVILCMPFIASANHKAEVAGQTLIDSNDPNISPGVHENCEHIHYHGTLNGVSDPDPNGCGHGHVTVIAHGEGDGETIPAPLPKGPSFPARVWGWLKSWFTEEQRETIGNVVDVAAESNGLPPPGTVSDTVDIVREAAPSIKDNADNAEAYYDTYTDPNEPDRDRYTLEGENPEENAPAPGIYRWFWSWFE